MGCGGTKPQAAYVEKGAGSRASTIGTLLTAGPATRLTVATLDQKMVEMEYAVRGAVPAAAASLKARLANGEQLPFKDLIPCNIGNPHAVRQKPITFYRQVAACCTYPELMDAKDQGLMPSDAVTRAREYLAGTGNNGMGSYTDSNGLAVVRNQIAEFIKERDGFPCDPNDISLTTGASEGVKRCLAAILSSANDGVMIPCPQYPLYSAGITMFGGRLVYYDLDESQNWRVTRAELDRAYKDALKNDDNLRLIKAIAVINPGNPSGSVLSKDDVHMIVTFAKDMGLVILADEVYQANVYTEEKEFTSFKKALRTLQTQSKTYNSVQLVSFHSTSKGLIGECGQRGGYAEFIGFSSATMSEFTKVAATSLSSNTLGQIFCGLMVQPPRKGEPSYELFKKETDDIYDGLKQRSQLLQLGLQEIEGITCAKIEGAMYGFPSISLPEKARKVASEKKMAADEFWCLNLVEKTGIVCVPGSGFGQAPGTNHFRITILPPGDMLTDMLKRLKDFQEQFLVEFG